MLQPYVKIRAMIFQLNLDELSNYTLELEVDATIGIPFATLRGQSSVTVKLQIPAILLGDAR